MCIIPSYHLRYQDLSIGIPQLYHMVTRYHTIPHGSGGCCRGSATDRFQKTNIKQNNQDEALVGGPQASSSKNLTKEKHIRHPYRRGGVGMHVSVIKKDFG
jgi:hypothetical protein